MSTDSGRPLYYLVGTTGFPNYGDEIIAATWLRYLAQTAPDAEVWLDCPSPGPAQVMLGDLHPRVRFTDTLWRLCWEAPTDEPWGVADFAQRCVDFPGIAPRWVAGVELLARADVVHIIGGGYVNRIWPRHVGLLAGAVAAVRRSGGRAAMTGIGLYPAPSHCEPLLRELSQRFEVVDVRDAPSAEMLSKTVSVTHSCDDVFFGLGPQLYRQDDDVREVMVCMQSDLVELGVPRLAGFVLDTLRDWGVDSSRLGVVECIPRVDREVFSLIEHELPDARFYPLSELMDTGLPAAPGQTWISSRFHPHLIASAVGASGIAVSVSPDYYATKHRSLIDLGSGWTMVEDVTETPARPTDGGYSPEALREYRMRKDQVARQVYAP
ncbi:polysaccharide pyruvyl transferase WcaK-like protein [Actinoalloteichus hoggarensis]|uniref:Polysaccharide pyruvyl transferase n=1 Tax=Actinoalloteichus hoggarensis TaxID=1470176 RepID=A0A221WB90_9PSEU|nr:polysaccharide pyruvyl transferase family protein [Actinoalloteichus hoggarensis]ASO23095.1 Polysaccharide pyruvyl transferase [Actinoalloteichus hoggarensis]MBB5922700.1 polysaccharide pyruvyl transferase WcaK-like protein [Actinoalloteichus hoggarensis]